MGGGNSGMARQEGADLLGFFAGSPKLIQDACDLRLPAEFQAHVGEMEELASVSSYLHGIQFLLALPAWTLPVVALSVPNWAGPQRQHVWHKELPWHWQSGGARCICDCLLWFGDS